MASDEDYMSFLDKANRDPSEGVARSQHTSAGAKVEFKTADEGVSPPQTLVSAVGDRFYSSDADEPFVTVALRWDGGGLPDEESLAKLIHHPDPSKAEVEIMDPYDWDSRGQYKDIIEAVTRAGKGNDVRVYRIAKGGARVEYWVLTTAEDGGGGGKGGRLVGVKALAVES